ncbi:opioid growth factor receptor-like protein 1 [Mercenaria mercenaria]|uniref:opioid growth factor receptor-like protein 1 n=1 Tax=Mercenaria mercenaria TaxID=6596 RepID=UPI00234FB24E|nr:opioid growth factor receptor-like protein 1 [Mercenaria mercenaria]
MKAKKEISKEVENLSKEVETLQEDKKIIEEEVKKYKEENTNLKAWSMKLSMNEGYVQHIKLDIETAKNVDTSYSVPSFHGYSTCDETMMKKMYDETLTRKKQADIDTEEYRSGYPDQEDNLDLNENYQFFMNEIPSKPQGDYIDTIHEQWWGDFTKLEGIANVCSG